LSLSDFLALSVRVTNIISSFLMIALTLHGRFFLSLSQTRSPLSLIFSHVFPPSLVAPSRVSSATTDTSLTTPALAHSASLMVSPFACLALTPLSKMVKPNASFGHLFQASLPPSYWVEALHTATYLLNWRPSKTLAQQTPYVALHDSPPSYDHLRVFECKCYPNTSAMAAHKLAPRSSLCVFLGYIENHKGNPNTSVL
jgi:hypothetical protein